MIVVLAGTNRPGSNTLKVARMAESGLRRLGQEVHLLDLAALPPELFDPSSYAEKPPGFAPFQQAILDASGLLVVTPEYNGSFPGVLKYFVDMLRFPESLLEMPVAFIGLAAGRWGAMRSVEQLELIFQYRNAHVFGRRLFIPGINDALDSKGTLVEPALQQLFDSLIEGFADFCQRLR
jgi:chromate reductase